ncbi:MAG: hypothetical protein ABIQ18_20500 [Umezawaea sp.]
MRNTLLRVLAAAFLMVAVTNTLIGISNHVTWPYVVAVLCTLVSGGLLACSRVTEVPENAQPPDALFSEEGLDGTGTQDDRPHKPRQESPRALR